MLVNNVYVSSQNTSQFNFIWRLFSQLSITYRSTKDQKIICNPPMWLSYIKTILFTGGVEAKLSDLRAGVGGRTATHHHLGQQRNLGLSTLFTWSQRQHLFHQRLLMELRHFLITNFHPRIDGIKFVDRVPWPLIEYQCTVNKILALRGH